VTSEFDGCKGFLDVNFNDGLFEAVIDLEKESGDWLLLPQGFETSGLLFQGTKSNNIKNLEDMSCLRGKYDDLHSDKGENSDNVI
jgi:hypothetical protein